MFTSRLWCSVTSLSRSVKYIYRNNYFSSNKVIPSHTSVKIYTERNICTDTVLLSKMVDPKRVVSYEDMLKVIHQPEKVIIDVRNPEEIHSTGKIPSSINIPLNSVDNVLSSMSEEEFKKQFQRPKPLSSDELIFYCQSGKRSSEALDKALRLGYSKSKTYLGSWHDWSSRQS